MSQLINSYKELRVYSSAVDLAMQIFQMTKQFPAEEKFSLTDQIRRSSRSICANIGEAWRKRRYEAAFIAKLSDAETEATETQVWLEMAFRCGYIDREILVNLDEAYDRIIAQLVRMIDDPAKWTMNSNSSSPALPLSRSPIQKGTKCSSG